MGQVCVWAGVMGAHGGGAGVVGVGGVGGGWGGGGGCGGGAVWVDVWGAGSGARGVPLAPAFWQSAGRQCACTGLHLGGAGRQAARSAGRSPPAAILAVEAATNHGQKEGGGRRHACAAGNAAVLYWISTHEPAAGKGRRGGRRLGAGKGGFGRASHQAATHVRPSGRPCDAGTGRRPPPPAVRGPGPQPRAWCGLPCGRRLRVQGRGVGVWRGRGSLRIPCGRASLPLLAAPNLPA
jgi:hypothetical protein